VPAITIPEEHVSGLARILALSPDDIRRVVPALGNAKSVSLRELTELVSTALPRVGLKESREIVQTLLSLYSVRTGMDLSVDQFISELLAAAKQIQLPEPQCPEGLRDLLTARPLSMFSKARGVHIDHENIFCGVRILTDLRPVFDADVSQEPAGFVMAHMLRLSYHHAGKHTSLHVAMDKVDIDNLITALERAKAKAASIVAVSAKAGFHILAD
jgi:hypothetical protein